ncbi:MAG TPA: DUF2851 family protein [Moheibacter sp.]|nr:DUF2851 family protein [Moheibacter sp.]
MKEKFLHFIWKFQLLNHSGLYTTDGNLVEILERGLWNDKDSGPDFGMAKIKIENEIWAGNIEIHVKSSDWDLHKHSSNKAYSNVILHVVFAHDSEIEFLQKRRIPTLELQNFIPKEILFNYQKLMANEENFIACEKNISTIKKEILDLWLERLLIERLERRSEEFEKEFRQNGKNWEQLLFKKLAYTFGLKINAEAFSLWADSFDFKILQKIQKNPDSVYALFLGQAGFLVEPNPNEYIQKLQNEYAFLQNKFGLTPLNAALFKFFRLRPVSFPTIRLMQLATVYIHYQNLFTFLMGTKSAEKIYPVFLDLNYPPFWEDHYTLSKESPRKVVKKITPDLVERIMINVLVTMKFVYAKSVGKEVSDELLDLLQSLPAEENTIIKRFSEMGWKAENALQSQAYLELKKFYCDEKKCLNCSIGLQILKNV